MKTTKTAVDFIDKTVAQPGSASAENKDVRKLSLFHGLEIIFAGHPHQLPAKFKLKNEHSEPFTLPLNSSRHPLVATSP